MAHTAVTGLLPCLLAVLLKAKGSVNHSSV